NLRDFNTIKVLFLEKYQHCVSYTPTITDLVREKMKPDEDFVTFVQRWRSLAAKSNCLLAEPEQIQMIVANALPYFHTWMTVTGCPTTFSKLYKRGSNVQATLKELSFQIYASKYKPPRKDQGPVTEGVQINEQINLVNQRLHPNQAAQLNPQNPVYN